jgi:predicted porin
MLALIRIEFGCIETSKINSRKLIKQQVFGGDRVKSASVVGMAFGFLSVTAYAQNNVTVYGLLDTGIEYVSHADAAGHGVTRMPGVSGELPSRLGFRGSEDIGEGLKVVYVLENGFNVRRGDLGQGGRLF